MKLLTKHPAIGAFVLCAVALASGCNGSSDKLTLESYFASFEKLDRVRSQENESLTRQLEALDDAEVDQARSLLRKQVDLIDVFVRDAGKLDAPAEVGEAHDGALDGLSAASSDFKKALDAAGEPDSMDQLRAAFAAVDFSRLDAAGRNCRELERIASDHDISIDLDCGD